MNKPEKILLSSITIAVLTLISQTSAAEQAPGGAAGSSANKEVSAEVQQVVVTGTAAGSVRKLDAAFSITTATAEQIRDANPTSTADLLKISPGVYAEATGGQAGANISVRGFPSNSDSPFVTIEMNGSPLYPPPTLNFFEGSSIFRLDDTIERVEVLRGGPSPVFGNGQPGATVNFILKKGTDTPEGTLRTTFGTGKLHRIDGYYGGKIAEGWYASLGGFYRSEHTVKDAGFPANDGGQLTATLTRKLDNGEITAYVRNLDDKNAFLTSIPLLQDPNSKELSPFPGFDPLKGVFQGPALRQIHSDIGNGKFLEKDLASGRGASLTTFGVNFDQKVNGFTISNNLNYTSGDVPTLALFNGGSVPQTMQAYINSQLSRSPGATGGSAFYVNGGAAVDPSQQVTPVGLWSVEKQIQSMTDELRISKQLNQSHTMTVGAYIADYSNKDLWYLGNQVLITAQSQGRPIRVNLNNGAQVTDANGYQSGATFSMRESDNGRNGAVFLADEWTVNNRIKVDGGVRYERQEASLVREGQTSTDTDGNPLTLYNNSVSVLNGSSTTWDQKNHLFAWTLGGNYKVSENFSVFVRANHGGTMPQFGTIQGLSTPNGVACAPGSQVCEAPVVKAKQAEIGLKTVGEKYSAYLTLFHNKFTGLVNTVLDANGISSSTLGGSKGYGLEYDVTVRPIRNLKIALTGDYQKSENKDYDEAKYPGYNGKWILRQPRSQFRLTPAYSLPLGENRMRVFGTYSYVGKRYSDLQNAQAMPSYKTLDAGLAFEFGDKVELRLSGTNLDNELGISEVNVRASPTPVSGTVQNAFFGRPLLGRAFEASLLYRF